MKAALLRVWFQEEWSRGVKFAEGRGASPGAIRALKAYAELDVQETLETLAETGADDPTRGARVLQAWRRWYPDYVLAETTRVLPELMIRWPGEQAKRVAERSRKALDRWCSDGENVLAVVQSSPSGLFPAAEARGALGMSVGRFGRVVDGLKAVGAVKLQGLYLVAMLNAGLVRNALRERWLGRD